MQQQNKKQRLDDTATAVAQLVAMGATDLSALAEKGKLARAYGRNREVERVFAALAEKRGVLLLGPTGVGKTAIRNEVVARIALGEAPTLLHGLRFVEMSTTAIEAGSMNAGQWGGRLQTVVDALIRGKRVCLYLSNIWDLRDAGRYSGMSESFATFLRSYLESRAIVVMGESTQESFARASTHGMSHAFSLASDPALVGLFSVIPVGEPDAEATRAIVRSVALDLERAHGVQIDRPALERAVELTRRFQPYQAFPGKVVHLLGEVVRARRAAEGLAAHDAEDRVTPEDVMAGFSRLTGLPEKVFSDRVPLDHAQVRAYFAERVVGQDEAVGAIADLVTLVKAELTDPGRPLGVFLFVGPTGTGKTFLAKTLAEFLFGSADRMIRFDMSEYKQPESTPNLARLLVEKVRQQAFSVLLLDEIEKAAWPVFDLFLQAFDDGRLSAPDGRTADLRNTIVVMTSNLGSDLASARALGFRAEASRQTAPGERVVGVVEEYFRPEFVNRLDRIVAFRPLGREEMRRIARRELAKALQREGVTRRNILLDFRDEVLDVIVAAGFTERYGARPLQRAIKERVLLPLARRIAADPAAGDELLELCARDGDIVFEPIPLGPSDAGPPHPLLADEDPAPEQRPGRSMGLAELEEATATLRERTAAHLASQRFARLQEATRELLDEAARPSFWDTPDSARATLTAAYASERITDLLADLHRRAEELAQVPMFVRRHRDLAALPRLERRYRELLQDVEIAELDFLAHDPRGSPTLGAAVLVSPVDVPRAADAGAWANELRGMYAAWAGRRGLETDVVALAGAEPVLVVRGPGAAGLLRGEEGVHKRQTANDPRRSVTELARVEVLPLPAGDGDPADIGGVVAAHRARLRPGEAGRGDLVRVYTRGRTSAVRDPRTGARSGRLGDVMAGRIDPFLLAYLRHAADITAPDGFEAGVGIGRQETG